MLHLSTSKLASALARAALPAFKSCGSLNPRLDRSFKSGRQYFKLKGRTHPSGPIYMGKVRCTKHSGVREKLMARLRGVLRPLPWIVHSPKGSRVVVVCVFVFQWKNVVSDPFHRFMEHANDRDRVPHITAQIYSGDLKICSVHIFRHDGVSEQMPDMDSY